MTTQNNRHDSFDYSEKTKSKHVVTFEHNSGGKGGTLPSTNKSTMPEPPIPGKK